MAIKERQGGVKATIVTAASTGPHASPSQLLMAAVWLDDKVPISTDYKRSATTEQRLSPSHQRRVQGLDIAVDWSDRAVDCVAVRLRMLGPTIDSGNSTGATYSTSLPSLH